MFFDKEKDTRKSIGNIFGEARQIVFRNGNKDIKNNKEPNEIFFSIEKIKRPVLIGRYEWEHTMYGYMRVTPEVKEILNTLIQENGLEYSIEFIEWPDDTFNVVFQSVRYKQSVSYCLSKEDFMAFEKSVVPYQKKK